MDAFIIAVPFLLFSLSVIAKPVHLDCTTIDPKEKGSSYNFTIKLNKDNKKVTHTEQERVFNAIGFFSTNEISYKKIDRIGGAISSEKFKINRTTLAIQIDYLLEAADPQYRSPHSTIAYVQKGSCYIIEEKNRKI